MGIQLVAPFIDESDKKAVLDAIESGWINTIGPYIDKFEQELANWVQTSDCVLTANGTSGLFISMKAFNIGLGDKVIVPTTTFVASINSIVHTGAEPIFFDCGDDLNIDLDQVEEYLKHNYSEKTKAIMPVHLFGNPCDMDRINKLANKYNLVVIEDACEALGSIYNNKQCGAFGDIGVFSFSFNKIITSGNGGAVVTSLPEKAEKIRYWIKQSKDNPQYHIHNEVGYNLGLTNIQAALGYSQFEKLVGIIKRKHHIIKEYIKYLGQENIIFKQGSNGWFVAYKTNKQIEIQNILRENNIQNRILFRPNHLQKPFRKYEKYHSLDNSIKYYNSIINLPCSINLPDADIGFICNLINKVERKI